MYSNLDLTAFRTRRSMGGRDPFSGFGFGSSGSHRSLLSGFFGGRDPFDAPYFTPPFGGMFESGIFGPTGNFSGVAHPSGFLENHVQQRPNKSRGPIIEEINSDDEKDGRDERRENPRKHGRSSIEPYVEDPDDEVEGRESMPMQHMNDVSSVNNAHLDPQTHSFTFQSSTISYGGANGTYYTSTKARRTGSDGLTLGESREANSATGQATHQISRGIHDKGHMVAKKLNSNGRVDTMQTLHNLNIDELSVFEDTWRGSARKHLPGWSEGFNVHDGRNQGGYALPSTEHTRQLGSMSGHSGEMAGPGRPNRWERMKADNGERTGFCGSKPKSA
ncbi:uncharacterized protein LOC127812538 isoform X2 [Diospyros lotus]|uniref:uncharacterized protein LOC127812538 isoform X2 n=1 Tax=Diospyros lotus TaxID=55363 RepID=UPI0022545B6C|nr:uncharacterized protein LOC127812538 isoform X2 [Diospyros lotus]